MTSGHSYGTLPDGTKMSINSNWDAELFRKEYNRQSAKSNPTSTTKISNASSSDIPWWSAGQQSGITAPSEKIPQTNPTIMSKRGLEFLALAEGGNRTVEYDDGAGYPTIGVGHLILPNEEYKLNEDGKKTITHEEGLAMFAADCQWAQETVTNYANSKDIVLSQNQYDAFVSLAYWGPSPFRDCFDEIFTDGMEPLAAFGQYTRSGNSRPPGLISRRAAEADIFVNGANYTSYPYPYN